MIKSIYAFTSSGIPILNWNYDKSQKDYPAHEILVSGVISAIQSFVNDVFLTRLQRIILENDVVVITGKDFAHQSSSNSKTKNILIISALVDKIDNSILVDNILISILDEIGRNFDFSRSTIIEEINLDPFIDSNISGKTKSRTDKDVFISFLLVLVSIFILSFFFNFNFDPYLDEFTRTILQTLGVTLIGILLIIPTTFFAGKRIYSILSGFSGCFLSSFLTDYLFRYIIDSSYFQHGAGTFAAYFLVLIFIGIFGGYIGGYLAERMYLFPPEIEKDS
ncbi:MAG: hypothetical protein ACFFD1_13285 [Candidatus Thorarchaeota archaeon]